jgi:hypothetical protein
VSSPHRKGFDMNRDDLGRISDSLISLREWAYINNIVMDDEDDGGFYNSITRLLIILDDIMKN